MSPSSPQDSFAVILTALGLETAAVLRHVPGYTDEIVGGTTFFRGNIPGWRLAIAEVGAGNTGAAAIATRAIEHYKPTIALFVGIAGGVKDVTIGDVVVGTKIYGYESGKDTATGLKTRADVLSCAHDLDQAARAIRQRHDWKKRLDKTLKHGTPILHVGPIAAGEKVVSSKRSETAKFLKEHYGDTLAIEMEGRGFLQSVHINNSVRGGVIRGISDLLSKKQQADKGGSQERAADAASAVAFEILARLQQSAGTTTSDPVPPQILERSPTFASSAYFEMSEVLAQVGLAGIDRIDYSFTRTPEAFLRIIPSKRLDRPIPFASLNAIAARTPLLRNQTFGGITGLNKYGAIHFDGRSSGGGPAPLHFATQLFANGEIWCATDSLMIREHNGRPAWWPMPLIAAGIFEKIFYRALHGGISFAVEHLGLEFPCTIILGVVDILNSHLGVAEDDIRQIHAREVVVRRQLANADRLAIDAVLLTFFNDVFDKTGHPRPPGMNGFPPGPPV